MNNRQLPKTANSFALGRVGRLPLQLEFSLEEVEDKRVLAALVHAVLARVHPARVDKHVSVHVRCVCVCVCVCVIEQGWDA